MRADQYQLRRAIAAQGNLDPNADRIVKLEIDLLAASRYCSASAAEGMVKTYGRIAINLMAAAQRGEPGAAEAYVAFAMDAFGLSSDEALDELQQARSTNSARA